MTDQLDYTGTRASIVLPSRQKLENGETGSGGTRTPPRSPEGTAKSVFASSGDVPAGGIVGQNGKKVHRFAV